MKFFYSVLLFSTLLTTTYCSKSYHEPEATAPELRITPDIRTRATDTNFENQDAIGVTVRKQDGTNYLTNQKFTYDGSSFSANGTQWYPETEETSTVIAYYPYAEIGQPSSFSVKTDQRGTGYTLSDLLGATKSDVKPTIDPVALTFYHLLSKIDIQTIVPEGITIEEIKIGGFIPTVNANIETQTVTVDANATATQITPHEITANNTYDIILPPQKAQMRIDVKTSAGRIITQSFSNVTLLQGKRYTLQLNVPQSGESIEVKFTGQIQDWGSGGVIEEDMDENSIVITEPETPDQGEAGQGLTYGNVTYKTQIIAGQEWMAENLRYIPEGANRGIDYKYPEHDEKLAETLGVLYPYKTAVAGAEPVLDDAATIRGICPEGWRLPKIGELVELVKIAGRTFFTEAGFFTTGNDNSYTTQRSFVVSSTQHINSEYNDCLELEYLQIRHVGQQIIIQTSSIPVENIYASIRCVKEQTVQ